MAVPPFKYQNPFPVGKDETEYYLLTIDQRGYFDFKF